MKQAVTLALAFLLFAVASPSSTAAETVVVRLQNGRQLSATIHENSDDQRLWLQYGTRAVTVIRPVAWQDIAEASHQDRQIDITQLKALAIRPASPEAAISPEPRIVRISAADQHDAGESMARRAQQALGFTSQVRSVTFDASLANWDGDVETDGLLVRLYPIDSLGEFTTASGTLNVEFLARRQRAFNDVPSRGGASLDRIGRWSVQIDEADFRHGAATVKLPFQAIHPEFDTDWFADGLVHVRFTVAGVGTFEHSLDGVRTRPFSPLRDAEQTQTGRRFLPSERTVRGQRSEG